MSNFVIPLQKVVADDYPDIGGKAINLAKMIQADLPVPNGFVVTLKSFKNGKLGDGHVEHIQKLIKNNKLYAVRSSALSEDGLETSWAGQFESYLNVLPSEIIVNIIKCHNSAKNRAKSYARENNLPENNFKVAVIVQEMIKPDYAGVLFTRDPISGENRLVCEYVIGLAEKLVSGQADPVRMSWNFGSAPKAPFDTARLSTLASEIEKIFGNGQDIEWAVSKNNFWVVQSRPITAIEKHRENFFLGKPKDLFYWGPARTIPMYMSDWMEATNQVFREIYTGSIYPKVPKSQVIFHADKMVMLFNSKDFYRWTNALFEIYSKNNSVEKDMIKWQNLASKLENLSIKNFEKQIIAAWRLTIIPEFSLYGAEISLASKLERFDDNTRQIIWKNFTIPDGGTFLTNIDIELMGCKDPSYMAEKYPWIEDGYGGISNSAREYFTKRLKLLKNEKNYINKTPINQSKLAEKYCLSKEELDLMKITRHLAKFMDERKMWMMKTRHLIKRPVAEIGSGCFYNEGRIIILNKKEARDIWNRYVDFRLASKAIAGVVACRGNKHYLKGEIAIIANSSQSVAKNKILVVPSTSPSYVPLMRSAQALITDHGGMMSHAAIVAREFGLPCIVGTKQATKVLKTGDKVILDLVKGEINK